MRELFDNRFKILKITFLELDLLWIVVNIVEAKSNRRSVARESSHIGPEYRVIHWRVVLTLGALLWEELSQCVSETFGKVLATRVLRQKTIFSVARDVILPVPRHVGGISIVGGSA